MKKLYFLILLFLLNESPLSSKGLYVDGFSTILGNANKEDSLLNYAAQNGFTYLALYELHLVHAAHDLTTVPTSQILATFISKAKTLYGVQEIGACGENFWWFDNIISVYNSIHSNPDEKIDVYNLEFEFWNLGSVSPGQYYCTTYLAPGGFSCDTAGAFAFYMKELTSIDSLAMIDGAISEIYLGWFNQFQALQLIQKADRILLHSYVNNVANIYSYTQTRLSYLGSGPIVVDVIPIFSSEPAFLGPWLVSNPEVDAFTNYTNGFNAEVGLWKSKINLMSYHWFAYSYMPYGLPAGVDELGTLNYPVYPNPFFNQIHMINESQEDIGFCIFNALGEIVLSQSTSEKNILINVEFLPVGVYHLCVERDGKIISKKLLKAH